MIHRIHNPAGARASRRPTSGFTLIELLIVTVIIGLLALIALPKFTYTKEKTYVATMKGDLRNLATAQESYWNDNATYYAGSIPSTPLLYNPSVNVSITMNEGTSVGWAATASHSGTLRTCALFVGKASPPAPATTDGIIACN